MMSASAPTATPNATPLYNNPPVNPPCLEDIHRNIKSRLKDAGKVISDLAPLYKVMIEYSKSLENTKKLGEQVAQKFVDIGLTKVEFEWGHSFVTIGELQHNLNKGLDTWVSAMRELSTYHLAKAAERDKEDIHALSKKEKLSICSFEVNEGLAGDRRSQSINMKRIELQDILEKKKREILHEIDVFENTRCSSLAKKWVDVMAHQPFTANTNILDRFSKLKRIPSRAFSPPSPSINPGGSMPAKIEAALPSADSSPKIDAVLSPRSLERVYSLSQVPTIASRNSPPSSPTSQPIRMLPHTISQGTFQHFSSPLPATSSLHNLPLNTSPSQSIRSSVPLPNTTNGSSISFKNLLGKISKSISPVSPRENSSGSNASTTTSSSNNTSSKPESSGLQSASTTGSGKIKMGTIKKRRHTIIAPPETLSKDIAANMIPSERIMYPPKRNFAYEGQDSFCL